MKLSKIDSWFISYIDGVSVILTLSKKIIYYFKRTLAIHVKALFAAATLTSARSLPTLEISGTKSTQCIMDLTAKKCAEFAKLTNRTLRADLLEPEVSHLRIVA